MKLPNSLANKSMANTGMDRKPIKRGAGKRRADGKSLRLANEVGYIQRRAADHECQRISVSGLIIFRVSSTPGARR